MNAKRTKQKRPENLEERLQFLSEERVYNYLEGKLDIARLNPYLWIVLSLLSSVFLSLSTFPVKMSSLCPYQIFFSKGVIGLLITIAYMRLNRIKLRIRYFKIRVLFLFGFCLFLSSVAFIFCITFMDYSFSLLITYTFPLLSMFLTRIWIKEPIIITNVVYVLISLAPLVYFCLNQNVMAPANFEQSLLQNDLLNNYPDDDTSLYFILSVMISVIASMMLCFSQVAAKKLTSTKAHPTVYMIMIYFSIIVFGWIFVLTNGGFRSFTLGDGIYIVIETLIEFMGYLSYIKCFYLAPVSKLVSMSLLQISLKLASTQYLFNVYDTDYNFISCLFLLFSIPVFYIIKEFYSASKH